MNIKKNLIIIIIIHLTTLFISAQTGRVYFNTYQETKYSNGKIKEQADWKDGLIIGKRKLFNENGILIEEHSFSKDSIEFKNDRPYKGIGTLKTFYPNGSVASIIPIYENLKQIRADYEYDIKIDYDVPVKGYHSNGILAYEYKLDRPLCLNSSTSGNYKNINMFYPDVFLLNKTIIHDGLDAVVSFYHPTGSIFGNGKVHNGKKIGYWVLYHSNNKVESEGEFLEKGLNIEHKVGLWKFYNITGFLVNELEYYKYGGSNNFNYGDLINLNILYNDSGLKMKVIKYPSISDFNLYVDTIESFFPNGKLNFKYIDSIKIELFNGVKYKYSGKYESYYSNGNIKEIGFLSKISREKTLESEITINPCIMLPTKKIGRWYFFSEDGNIVKIIEYDFCGNIKSEIHNSKVNKENTKYQLQKKSYKFDYNVNL